MANRRNFRKIKTYADEEYKESTEVDHFTLESGLATLGQLVQGVSDSSAGREQRRRSQCIAESSIIPRFGATVAKGPEQNGAAYENGRSALGSSPESSTTNPGAKNDENQR